MGFEQPQFQVTLPTLGKMYVKIVLLKRVDENKTDSYFH